MLNLKSYVYLRARTIRIFTRQHYTRQTDSPICILMFFGAISPTINILNLKPSEVQRLQNCSKTCIVDIHVIASFKLDLLYFTVLAIKWSKKFLVRLTSTL